MEKLLFTILEIVTKDLNNEINGKTEKWADELVK